MPPFAARTARRLPRPRRGGVLMALLLGLCVALPDPVQAQAAAGAQATSQPGRQAQPDAGGKPAPGAPGGKSPRGPAEVGVMQLQKELVPLSVTLPGRAVAHAATSIRPRVGGIITEILYTPGTRVQAGAPLFSIDPLTYDAALVSARAALSRARAQLPVAEAALSRAQKLEGAATTTATLDAARAAALSARADVEEAEAQVRLAEAQVSWTRVTAPISGIIGVAAVSVGDLVTANQSEALAELVQIDPIYVDVTEPSVNGLRLAERIARGEVEAADAARLRLTLEDGTPYAPLGELVAPGPTVSATTATRLLRFRFPNPESRILPGMFLRGDLEQGRIEAILVPQRATTRGADGSLNAWVAEDGKAHARKLTASGNHGNAWVVEAGVSEGETLLVDGTTNLREGAEVKPVPVTIDELGVVRTIETPANDEAPAATPSTAPSGTATQSTDTQSSATQSSATQSSAARSSLAPVN